MVALLGKIRKQMNGAMLDTFRYYGANYGVNYGVAIHTLRDMATELGVDDSLSRFLYLQQVRELRIIALWIADATTVNTSDFDFWAKGIVNSEVSEQAAQALLCHIEQINQLLDCWGNEGSELLVYAAGLAASRSSRVQIDSAVKFVQKVVLRFTDNRLAAQGIVALLASKIATDRDTITTLLDSIADNPTSRLIKEEISWRLEY